MKCLWLEGENFDVSPKGPFIVYVQTWGGGRAGVTALVHLYCVLHAKGGGAQEKEYDIYFKNIIIGWNLRTDLTSGQT